MSLEPSWSQQSCIDRGGKLFLRQPTGGLPGLHPQQLLEVRLPLYGLNDSPRRWFLEVSTFLRDLGWKTSALDECVFMFYDPVSKVLAGILCLHVDDMLLGGRGAAYRQTVNTPPHFPGRHHQGDHSVAEHIRVEDQEGVRPGTSATRGQGHTNRSEESSVV